MLTELRKLVPPGAIVHLSTLLTAGTMVLVFAVQVTRGLVEDQFDGAPRRHPEEAYQAVFALLALIPQMSVMAYWAAVRPRRT